MRRIAEKRSIQLKISPVRAKNPFRRRRPDANSTSCKIGEIPKIRVRKIIAAKISIAPSILTKTIISVLFLF